MLAGFIDTKTKSIKELNKEVKLMSTDTPRTRGSAALFTENLFPNLPQKEVQKQILVKRREKDFKLYLTDKNCYLYRKLEFFIRRTPENKFIEHFRDYVILKYLPILGHDIVNGVSDFIMKKESAQKERYKNLQYNKNLPIEELLLTYGDAICSYLNWAILADLNLKPEVKKQLNDNPEIMTMCEVVD